MRAKPPGGQDRIGAVRVTVDESLCAATGECERICPEVFEVGDVARASMPEPHPSLQEVVREAEAACPTGAIIVSR
jgi:ferredoxin